MTDMDGLDWSKLPTELLKYKYVLIDRRVKQAESWREWIEFQMKGTGETQVAVYEGATASISTAFLGIDTSMGLVQPPPVFETMVFFRNRRSGAYVVDRYATWEAAEEGHRRAVSELKDERG